VKSARRKTGGLFFCLQRRLQIGEAALLDRVHSPHAGGHDARARDEGLGQAIVHLSLRQIRSPRKRARQPAQGVIAHEEMRPGLRDQRFDGRIEVAIRLSARCKNGFPLPALRSSTSSCSSLRYFGSAG